MKRVSLLSILLSFTLLLTACGTPDRAEEGPSDEPAGEAVTETPAEPEAPTPAEPESPAEPEGPSAEELEAQRRAALPVPETSDYVFDEDNVVVTFAALADTHLRVAGSKNSYTNDNFAAAVSFLTELTDGGLDAVFIAGDVTDSGLSGQVQSFANVLESLDIPVLFATGNHDMLNPAMFSYMEKNLLESAYAADIDTEENAQYCRHSVVNGVHFIQVSAAAYNKGQKSYTEEIVAWLQQRLAVAAEDAPGMPIFVSTHLPISNSVFGSDTVSAAHPTLVWASEELKTVLDEYPQAVLMTGHTHYPQAADNSIVQDGFTMVNVATLKHMVIDFWFDNSSDTLSGSNKHPGGMLVEVDGNGGVRMTRYDFGLGVQVGEAWVLPPQGHEDFLAVYTYGRANAPGPQFPDQTADISMAEDSATTRQLQLNFTAADSTPARVYYYQVDIKPANSTEITTKKYVTDFAFAPQAEDMEKELHLDLGSVSIGTIYDITLTPYNVWNVPGESLSFTVDLTLSN